MIGPLGSKVKEARSCLMLNTSKPEGSTEQYLDVFSSIRYELGKAKNSNEKMPI